MMNKFDINKNKLEIGDIVILYGCIEARTGEFEFWEVYADNKSTSHSVFIRGLTSRKSDSFHCDCLKKVDKKYKELVDKATPNKPIKDRPSKIRYVQTYVCPSCRNSFSGEISRFCYHCGQALDWSDERC